MDNIVVVDKNLLRSIINSLKKIEVRGFDSMDILVGCVMLLEQTLNAPKPVEDTQEEIISSESEDTN